MIIAHVAGVPLEEILPLLTGASGALLLARIGMTLRPARRSPSPRLASLKNRCRDTAERASR